MKTLHFEYDMRIKYAETAQKCHFTMRCKPVSTKRQHLKSFQIRFDPAARYGQGEDSFGNLLFFGRVDGAHRMFSFRAEGCAAVGMGEYEEDEQEGKSILYRYPGRLTAPGERLLAYFREIEWRSGKDARERGIVLMNRLHQDFSYEKNVTDMGTSAEEAFSLGRGVCQDYAHIMVALCRMAGIPARYVTGMLVGEGMSHAWVEILSDGRWYGLDPTNDQLVCERHIKIGVGRDAFDCPINRGVLQGGGAQEQEICVKVEEI